MRVQQLWPFCVECIILFHLADFDFGWNILLLCGTLEKELLQFVHHRNSLWAKTPQHPVDERTVNQLTQVNSGTCVLTAPDGRSWSTSSWERERLDAQWCRSCSKAEASGARPAFHGGATKNGRARWRGRRGWGRWVLGRTEREEGCPCRSCCWTAWGAGGGCDKWKWAGFRRFGRFCEGQTSGLQPGRFGTIPQHAEVRIDWQWKDRKTRVVIFGEVYLPDDFIVSLFEFAFVLSGSFLPSLATSGLSFSISARYFS